MKKKNLDAQVVVLTGHYGSGKSELAINIAINKRNSYKYTALLDLDIANPYFRSREMQGMLDDLGIDLISNAYGYDITADLPALSPMINSYILNQDINKVIDVGGNDSGARILNQYRASLKETDASIFIVVNIYRPETGSVEKIIKMIESIESETGLGICGIINNSNLLRNTTVGHITSSITMLKAVSKNTNIPIIATCCERRFYEVLKKSHSKIFPIDLYLRPNWLDRAVG